MVSSETQKVSLQSMACEGLELVLRAKGSLEQFWFKVKVTLPESVTESLLC